MHNAIIACGRLTDLSVFYHHNLYDVKGDQHGDKLETTETLGRGRNEWLYIYC